MTSSVPHTIDEVTGSWLTAVLRPSDGVTRALYDVERIGATYGFSSLLYRVTLDEGTPPCSVVLKLWSTEGPAGEGEVSFYDTFDGHMGIRLPVCHYGRIDTETHRGVLVLEDIHPAEQGDCLDTLDATRALRLARDVAAFHARWWQRPELDAEWLPSLGALSRDAAWYEPRRVRFLERFGDRLGPDCRPLFESVEAVQERSNAILADSPHTLLHGDLHLDNVLFEPGGGAVVLDWARAARGPAALDLCAVMLMTRSAHASTILDAYTDAMRKAGIDVDPDDMRRSVTGAMLRTFIAWTYGVARWETDTERKRAILAQSIPRIQDAVLAWRERDPEGFPW